MTNKEMQEQTTEMLYKFLKYLYNRGSFNFTGAVAVYERTPYNTPVPYQYQLRVVLKRLNILDSLSNGNYRWVASKPTLKMAQEAYTACLKSYKKTEVASPLKEVKEIKQAIKELVEDIYLIEPVTGNTGVLTIYPRDIYNNGKTLRVETNLKGLDAVRQTAIKTANGEEMTFVLYKRVGTITVTPLTTINYD